MFPTQNELTLHARKSIEEMRLWAAEYFGFTNLPLTMQIKFKADQNRIAVGGWDRLGGMIRFNMACLLTAEVQGMKEYASFTYCPVIGGFETKDWRLWVDTVLAHELAHVVQFGMWIMPMTKPLSGFDRRDQAHGSTFRTVYAILRRQFINHRVQGRIGTRVQRIFSTDGQSIQQRRQHTPEGQRVALTLSPGLVPNVIRVGSRLQHPRVGVITIVDYKPRNHKYPYIYEVGGRRFKTNNMTIAACKPL